MVHNQENARQSPDPFSSLRVGSVNETIFIVAYGLTIMLTGLGCFLLQRCLNLTLDPNIVLLASPALVSRRRPFTKRKGRHCFVKGLARETSPTPVREVLVNFTSWFYPTVRRQWCNCDAKPVDQTSLTG